ncbi:hypothetical protein [Kribbella sp. NPDC023855]|uniref:hypothetical protein n=1 Tax=Kribbella sp. NPDC023855 TaxID=3154698 RepID=UPI0033E8ECC4
MSEAENSGEAVSDDLRNVLRVAQDGVAEATAPRRRATNRATGRRATPQNPTRQREKERRR